MSPIRVPAWHAILPSDAPHVVEAFAELVAGVKLTQRDLATRLGTSPSALNHWATGRTEPSLEAMTEAVDALEALLRERLAHVEAMKAALASVNGVIEGHRRLSAEKTPEAREAHFKAIERLRDALTALGGENEA